MMRKIYGWPVSYDPNEGIQPIWIRDIAIHTNPTELRQLSKFFSDVANDMEKNIRLEPYSFRDAGEPDQVPTSIYIFKEQE